SRKDQRKEHPPSATTRAHQPTHPPISPSSIRRLRTYFRTKAKVNHAPLPHEHRSISTHHSATLATVHTVYGVFLHLSLSPDTTLPYLTQPVESCAGCTRFSSLLLRVSECALLLHQPTHHPTHHHPPPHCSTPRSVASSALQHLHPTVSCIPPARSDKSQLLSRDSHLPSRQVRSRPLHQAKSRHTPTPIKEEAHPTLYAKRNPSTSHPPRQPHSTFSLPLLGVRSTYPLIRLRHCSPPLAQVPYTHPARGPSHPCPISDPDAKDSLGLNSSGEPSPSITT
ncbi:hypothetical protein CSPX01_17285, partial [Colletotrichum filicis]